MAIINEQTQLLPPPTTITVCAIMDVSGGTVKKKHTIHLTKETKVAHGKCQAHALILVLSANQKEAELLCNSNDQVL